MRLFKSVVNVKFLEIFCVQVFCQLDISGFCAVDSDSTSVLLQKREIDSALYLLSSFRSGGRAPGEHDKNIYRLRLTLHLKYTARSSY